MKINRGMGGFAGGGVTKSITPATGAVSYAAPNVNHLTEKFAGGAVEKALELNVHSDGAISITSDQAGAKVEVGEVDPDTGKIAISELLADGSTGDTFEIGVAEPAGDDTTGEDTGVDVPMPGAVA